MSHPLRFEGRDQPPGEIPQTASAESGSAKAEDATQAGTVREARAAQASPGYKRTKLGVIPEDWETKPLGAICFMKSGESITSADIDDTSRFPCHGGNGLRGFTNRFTHSGRFALIGRQGALCGNVVGVSGQFFASEHAVVVTALQQTDIGWLTYVLRGMRLNQYSESSAQPGLSVAKLLLLDAACPPTKAEQRAIAAVLMDMDALIGSLEALIAKKRAIKQAAMQQLLIGRTRLPGFTGEWEVRRLGDLARIATGTRNNQDKRHGGRYPFFVRSSFVERIDSFAYDCEAVLVPGEGRIGEIFHYVHGRFDVHQRVYAITDFGSSVFGRFLYYYMAEHFGAHALKNTVKATVDSLRQPTFLAFQILLPPQREQRAVASVLSDIDAEIETLDRRLDKTRALKQGMMQQLLTGSIRLPFPDAVVENGPGR